MWATSNRTLVLSMTVMNWGIWILMFILIGSQFLGIVWDSSKSILTVAYGADLSSPPAPLPGSNDDPYADRVVVCMPQGRTFVATPISTVLDDKRLAPIVDTTGDSIHGFRVVQRTDKLQLQPTIAAFYSYVCDSIDITLPAIQDSCDAIGYNVTRDSLRIVNGVFGTTTQEITKPLPIIIVPFWDNGALLAFIIPSMDGTACIFMLHGIYESSTMTYGKFSATPKDSRLSQTVQRLKNPGGTWRNGWYEAPDGQRWYANMISSSNTGPFGLKLRDFDTLANKELFCNVTPELVPCQHGIEIERWGSQISTSLEYLETDQFVASNGSRFGLFRFESTRVFTVTNVYSLATFISNMSVFVILMRWFVSLAAMFYSSYSGVHDWQTTGIGAVSCLRTFNMLPIVLLPKLKLTLTAFFTVGCFFEGEQSAFSTAWYIIYPGIVEFMLCYYSILNIIAKTTYHRMSDVLFGPTLLILCALHYFREKLAAWPVLGLHGRIGTILLSDQVDAITLPEFFSTDVAMRINGNAKSIFYIKIILLALNLLPLLLAENMTEKRGRKLKAFTMCDIEHILALRASNLGGLGQSPIYARKPETTNPNAVRTFNSSRSVGVPTLQALKADLLVSDHGSHVSVRPSKTATVNPTSDDLSAPTVPHKHVLIGYEMSRIGYLVFGGQFLLSYDDWYILTSLTPLRNIEKLWNYRITVFQVSRDNDGTYRAMGSPRLCRLDDPQLRGIPFYQITVCAFQ